MDIPEKQYYSISEVAEITGVAQGCLRSWEREFQQLKPRRSTGGTRRYIRKDIDFIFNVKKMLNDGYTLSGVKERLKNFDIDKAVRVRKALDKLESIRKELVAIRSELNLNEALAQEVIIPGDNDPAFQTDNNYINE
ncbi:MAG: MerR family transcriptional regulator [Paludibacteraceae bacterium]|nr:MerR family transcriptional regulator [Paludibacteraceae bacterium]